MAGHIVEKALDSIRQQKAREIDRLRKRCQEQERRVRLAKQEAFRCASKALSLARDHCEQRLAQIERKAAMAPDDRARLAALELEVLRAQELVDSAKGILKQALSHLRLSGD